MFPPQRERLSPAQPGRRDQRQRRVIPQPLSSFQDGGDLPRVQVPGLLARDAGRLTGDCPEMASNAMRSCPCYLRLRASLTMPMMTGKTNVSTVDGPAVTDRN